MNKAIYYRLCSLRYIITSLRFNIHYFGWRNGMKLPVMFYCPVKLRDMKGRILINAPLQRSMISFGLPGNEMFDYKTPCIWSNQGGTIEFCGSFGTNPGASFVIRKDAKLRIGAQTSFGQNLRILCSEEIVFGDDILGSWDVTIMDTDSHYFENTVDGSRDAFSKPVFIGNHCFLGNGCTLLKGVSLPDGAIVASRAVVTKQFGKEYSLYAGIPARFIKEGIKYIK